MMERNLVILYGSQTGTATDVAKRIRKQARLRRFTTTLKAMNDFTVDELIKTPLIVFVCSTTGQGDPPDNMAKFWRLMLRRRLPANSLTALEFAVLGLGDSSYQEYNFAAKRLHRRLLKLGATAFHEMGLADDQHDLGFDGVAEPWIKALMEKLMVKFPLPEGEEVVSDEGLQVASFNIEFVSGASVDCVGSLDSTPQGDLVDDSRFLVELTSNERVTAEDHFQDVRLMKFATSQFDVKYEPGDVLVVIPENLPTAVDDLLRLLSLDGDRLVKLTVNEEDVTLPDPRLLNNPCTVRDAATKVWDFQGVPRRSFFELLLHFAGDEREKERLTEFASPAGTDDLYAYCIRPKRTAAEVLQDFSDTAKRIPFEYLFDLFPPIKPRSFSIASSLKYHPGELHILVAVVTYRTKLVLPRTGLCSNWLASLPTGTKLPIWVRKGTMNFKKVQNKPVIMVGPGTGVAPFRSFIHERAADKTSNSILFFGCRDRTKDFYFEQEWKSLQDEGFLTLPEPAFSREQEEKIYVQDTMKKYRELICDSILAQDGFFYLAGNSKNMPTEVKFALKRIFMEVGEMSVEEADQYLAQMATDGRYQTEVWG